MSAGETPSASPSGSLATLESILPGFLFVLAGGLPTLDLDGDLAQYFLDEDDDGDGLDDLFETGTGFFVSSTNTGTSPTTADTDGDGFSDGAEVLAGSDPNDNTSTPGVAQVPTLIGPIRILMALVLVFSVGRVLAVGQRERANGRLGKSAST